MRSWPRWKLKHFSFIIYALKSRHIQQRKLIVDELLRRRSTGGAHGQPHHHDAGHLDVRSFFLDLDFSDLEWCACVRACALRLLTGKGVEAGAGLYTGPGRGAGKMPREYYEMPTNRGRHRIGLAPARC